MKNMVVFFLIIVLLNACKNEPPKGTFSPEELSWLVYKPEDVVAFADTTGKKREQLKVVFRTELSQIKQYYPIEAEVALSDIDSLKSFRIYLLKDQNSFKKYLRIGEVYRSLDILKPVAEMQLGKNIYKDVYVVTEDTIKQKPFIWKVWFNKEKGVLQYTNLQNETFSLVE